MKASKAKDVTAVLWGKRCVLQEPSVFCLWASHSRALAVASLVASVILTSTASVGLASAAKAWFATTAGMTISAIQAALC